MRTTALLFLSLSSIVALASEARADPLEYIPGRCSTPEAKDNLYCGRREPTNEHQAACPNDRWIGFFLTAGAPPACPAAAAATDGVWLVERLFPTRSGIAPPNDLKAFCLYRWQPTTNAAPRVSALPNRGDLRMQRDCRVVSPLLEPVPQVADIAEWVYDAQANLPLFEGPLVPPPPVRVAIIDNVADETTSGRPSGPSTSHGHAMGALARHNSCFRDEGGNEFGCAAHVVSYQALPLSPFNGAGGYGTQATVAQAIVRAVQDFKAQNVQSRLIINLSLGWDGSYGGQEGPSVRTGALSAWMAAQWAACEGALIFASSGNRGADNAPIGPMFPAAWEIGPRLCQGNAGAYGPAVHAVGAVGAGDEPLLVSRVAAQPRLVAPGAFVAVWSQQGAVRTPTSLLTGTSIAAAGATGVAAMVWSLDPTLRATDVADQLHDQGVSIDGADFNNPDGPQDTRRLDACAAVASVNPLFVPSACPYRPSFTASYFLPGAGVRDAQWPGLYTGGPTPGSSAILGAIPAATLDPYLAPYVTTQPGKGTCPLCFQQAEIFTGELDLAGYTVDKVIYDVTCLPGYCDWPGAYSVEIQADFSKEFNIQMPFEANQLESGVLRVEVTGNDGSVSTLSTVKILY